MARSDNRPLVISSEEAAGWGFQEGAGREPITAQQATVDLERAISVLMQRPNAFHDPALALRHFRWNSDWPNDPEGLCSEGLLHAELWRNGETGEKLWALAALAPGGSPPHEEIEASVWHRVVNGIPQHASLGGR